MLLPAPERSYSMPQSVADSRCIVLNVHLAGAQVVAQMQQAIYQMIEILIIIFWYVKQI